MGSGVRFGAHLGNGWAFSAPNGGWEYPAFLTATAFAHALLGDGKYALASLWTGPSRARNLQGEYA